MVKAFPQSAGVLEEGEFTSYTRIANLTYSTIAANPKVQAYISESDGQVVIVVESPTATFLEAALTGTSGISVFFALPTRQTVTNEANVYQYASALAKYFIVVNSAGTMLTVYKKGASLQTIDFSGLNLGTTELGAAVSPSGAYIVIVGVDTAATGNKGFRMLIYQGS